MEQVILVDDKDNEIGEMEKLEAHREGRLHRAISVFVFNDRNEVLLQKRSEGKYHSGGKWSNACCTHPRKGEKNREAAERRLFEEMGIKCSLEEKMQFIYRAELGQGLTEHEFDHVFTGKYNGTPSPDESETEGWMWIPLDNLTEDIQRNPERYTYWLREIIEKHLDEITG